MAKKIILQEQNGQIQTWLQLDGNAIPKAYGFPRPWKSPLTAKEREQLRWYLEGYLDAPYGVYEEQGAAIAARLDAWGERLFQAAFPDEASRKAYHLATPHKASELWLSSESSAFLGLPWELLRDPDGKVLALEMARLTRVAALPDSVETDEAEGESLRVLMVIARPYGERDVGYQVIARRLMERLVAVGGRVRLEVLRPPTWAELQKRLIVAKKNEEPFHILHFDGHGAFGNAQSIGTFDSQHFRQGHQGHLVFETVTGSAEMVSAEVLGPALAEADVPLVVLNACQSAMLEDGSQPEAAVATRLLAGGAAAVVAMAYSVYAVAAAEFMAAFYEALFTGQPVSRAIVTGRRQMQQRPGRPSRKGLMPLADWFVPVHYARREVAFPELQPEKKPGDLSLEQILDALRQTQAIQPRQDGVHQEGELDAVDGIFLGRDNEFLALERALRLEHVILIQGTGGSGKTELAKGFARWLQISGGLDDPSHVFFHSFEPGIATFGLPGVLTSIGLRLLGTNFARLEFEERRAAVLHALQEARILLIWDNFESVHSMPDPQRITPSLDEAGRKEIQSFLRQVRKAARGGVILTSRSPEPWLGELHRLEIGALDRQTVDEYADRLLATNPVAQERRKDAAYQELLDLLGGHPLSLRLILPRLAQTSAAELVKGLKGETELPAGFSTIQGKSESLGACVHYSFQHLDAREQARLPVLMLFEGVADVGVLEVLSKIEDVPQRFAGVEKQAWETTLDACVRVGLVTELGLGLYRLHPALPSYLKALWRQLANDAYDEEIEAAGSANIKAHAALSNWLFQQIEGDEARTAFALLRLQQRNLGRVASEALARGWFDQAQAVLQALEKLWDITGMFEEARAWVDLVQELTEDSQGRAPSLETNEGRLWLFLIVSQANRYRQQQQLAKAEATHDSIRELLENSEGQQPRKHLAATYHNLGNVAQDRRDLDAADTWYQKALQVKEELGDRLHIASTYHQLGSVAMDRGDLDAADTWYRKSLQITEELGNRTGIAMSYHQMGMVSQRRRNLDDAEAWYRKALQIKEVLGSRPGMAMSYHQLGLIALDRGDLDDADTWCQKALQVFDELGDRPHMAATYHQLGMVAHERNELDDAEAWYQKALQIKEVLKADMSSSYHQLGIVAQKRGQPDAAETWYRKALQISEGLGDRPGMALTYAQLGLLTEQKGNKPSALLWAIRCASLFGEFPHPLTGTGPRDLVRLTAELGMDTLVSSWQRVTGKPLPDHVRQIVERSIAVAEERNAETSDGAR